jgi:hypothetical protein
MTLLKSRFAGRPGAVGVAVEVLVGVVTEGVGVVVVDAVGSGIAGVGVSTGASGAGVSSSFSSCRLA